MGNKVVEQQLKPTRYQIYLNRGLQDALQRYIGEHYPAGTRLTTAIFRRALAEFLEREGYYDRKVSTSQKENQ